jgi:hypothetical protein
MVIDLKADDDLEGEVVEVSPLQFRRIFNLDKTNVSLDGSNGNTGGWPAVVFTNTRHINPGKAISKAGQGVMMIRGSDAAGKPFPPHFEFPSKAETEETKCVHAALVQDKLDVVVQFGQPEKIRLLPSVGMNPKGGMDNDEFHKYLLGLVSHLNPDAANVAGKCVCVLIKCDSGPGHDNLEQLASLHFTYLLPFQILPL